MSNTADKEAYLKKAGVIRRTQEKEKANNFST